MLRDAFCVVYFAVLHGVPTPGAWCRAACIMMMFIQATAHGLPVQAPCINANPHDGDYFKMYLGGVAFKPGDMASMSAMVGIAEAGRGDVPMPYLSFKALMRPAEDARDRMFPDPDAFGTYSW